MQWLDQISKLSLTDLASFATVASLLITAVGLFIAVLGVALPLASIAFSAARFVREGEAERAREQFRLYHKLIADISRGKDEQGQSHKLVSQLAHIYELRNFPAYAVLTAELLERLAREWQENDPTSRNHSALQLAIAGTLEALNTPKTSWRSAARGFSRRSKFATTATHVPSLQSSEGGFRKHLESTKTG